MMGGKGVGVTTKGQLEGDLCSGGIVYVLIVDSCMNLHM